MEDLYLVYIHRIGHDYKDIFFYEFIFSSTIVGIDGDGWDSYPASGNPYPPYENLIAQVGKVNSDIKLSLLQDNEQFSMWDGIDGVIALGWQNIDGMEEYPESRLTFSFGMKIKDVESLLYERDIIMKYEKNLTND
jgi:hypothetical protein